jgi:hypothetical protein
VNKSGIAMRNGNQILKQKKLTIGIEAGDRASR